MDTHATAASCRRQRNNLPSGCLSVLLSKAQMIFPHLFSSELSESPCGEVTIPGGVQKTCRCDTSGHGLAGVVVLG